MPPRPEPRRWRLRTRLLAPIVVLVVGAAAALVVFQSLSAQGQVAELVEQRGTAVLEGIARRVDERQRSKEVFAHLIAEQSSLATMVQRRDQVGLAQVLLPLKLKLGLGRISAYDEAGGELLSLGSAEPSTIASRLVPTGLAGLTRSTAIVDDDGLAISASAPIKGVSGIVGAIVVGTTLKGDDLREVPGREAVDVAVFKAGSLAATTIRQPDLVGMLVRSEPHAGSLDRLNAALRSFEFDAVAKPVGEDGLLVALMPTGDLTRTAWQRSLIAVFGTAALLAVLLAFGLWLAGDIARPLQAIVAVTGAMARGEYHRRAPPNPIWELDELAGAVNHLAQQTEAHVAALGSVLGREQAARGDAVAAQKWVEALYQATEQVNESLDLDRVLSTVIDAAGRLFAADRTAIYYRNELGACVCPASHGLSKAYVETICRHFAISAGARAVATRQAIAVTDLVAAMAGTPIGDAAAAEGVTSLLALPLLRGGEAIGFLVIYHDRPREYVEREIQVAQGLANQAAVAVEHARLFAEVGKLEALRELDRLKTEFIATVSHELRTPLSLVYGYAELLLNRRLVEGDARPMVEAMFHGAKQLTGLVDDVVDISRIERGEFRLEFGDVELRALVAHAVAQTDSTARARLSTELPERAVFVHGDAPRLSQVVQNLLSNAIRYSPDGRPITVQVAAVDGQAQVSVTDQGIGLSPDQLERVFEKFYRGRSPVMHQRPGIGLGLAISRFIVEAHGGRIWAESAGLGKGATVHFSLPLAAGLTAESPSPTAAGEGDSAIGVDASLPRTTSTSEPSSR